MISVSEARELIRINCDPLAPITIALQEAAGKILATDIYSPLNIPAYPQSSMDGYAFAFSSWKESGDLVLFGEIAAGRGDELQLPPGKAARIFTGAPVPPGADTVVMQEKCQVEGGKLIINDELLKTGDNVRPTGSEISTGALALEKGTLLTPPAIGFLAGIGLTEISVYPTPVVSIIVTGNELQTPGSPLAYGQVYESNSLSLTAALTQASLASPTIYRVEDQLEILAKTLAVALEQSDIVLLTGGISVGDYDFTLKATQLCGVETIFHKIRQRPGKPLFFGRKESKLVFGLPGNPSSVLTCYYEYVTQAIGILQNRSITLKQQFVKLANAYKKQAVITHFLKGLLQEDTVSSLDAQESYKLNSFAKANCLIVIPEDITSYQAGDLVEIHHLPI